MSERRRGAEPPKPARDSRDVKEARVLAHKAGHWSILLVIDKHKNPPSLNMKVGPGDENSTTLPGEVDWTPLRDYDEEWFSSNSWNYPMNEGVSVERIYKFVKDKHLDEYKFKKAGESFEGCRHWVYTVIKLLGEEGLLQNKKAGEDLLPIIRVDRSELGTGEVKQIVPGTFSQPIKKSLPKYPDTKTPQLPSS